jgi:hypothetical protein
MRKLAIYQSLIPYFPIFMSFAEKWLEFVWYCYRQKEINNKLYKSLTCFSPSFYDRKWQETCDYTELTEHKHYINWWIGA